MKMKAPLKKLRELGIHKEKRDRRLQQSLAQLNELARASQDLQDMRGCYDSLLSAAAATANSAYEFSESLKEMGACLLEKTALNDDEESGKVLLMLGKLQFGLQELVDNYRKHIFQTITVPSESLLNELQTVEEMQRQCDDKRRVYEDMIAACREKKRSKYSKGESFSSQQLQAARDEYDDEASLFVFRLKSLKQGQSRSLLTQAARHHAAQLCFFKKALISLEAVEPEVQLVTEQKHIDYKFSGLEDDDSDIDDTDCDDDEDDDDTDEDDDGELSSYCRQKEPGSGVVSMPRSSMEKSFGRTCNVDAFALSKELKLSSQSAPLSAEKKFESYGRLKELQPSNSRKFHSYVLPTPIERKSPVSTRPNTHVSEPKRSSLSGIALSYRHSSPLEQNNYKRTFGNENLSGPINRSRSPVLKERDDDIALTNLPASLAKEISSETYDRYTDYGAKRFKRLSFSGPLIGMPQSNMMGISASGPITSIGQPMLYLGPLSGTSFPQPSLSPQRSPSASPLVSSPRISELHVLPRPPLHPGASCPLPTHPQPPIAL